MASVLNDCRFGGTDRCLVHKNPKEILPAIVAHRESSERNFQWMRDNKNICSVAILWAEDVALYHGIDHETFMLALAGGKDL